MPTESILLLGAGGHGKVVLDALLAAGVPRAAVDVSDENAAAHGAEFLGAPVCALGESAARRFHVSVGVAAARERIHLRLEAAGLAPLTVRHPAACVSPLASLAGGCFVAAHAVVGPAARLGPSVIVNHGAVVDHDCVVGAFCHIAPNATLAGNVTIGRRVLVGAGANLLPGVRVGDDAIIGAGAVVRADVPAGGTWAGVPATKIDRKAK